MKRELHYLLGVAAVLLLTTVLSQAQTTNVVTKDSITTPAAGGNGNGNGKNKPSISQRPTVISRDGNPSGDDPGNSKGNNGNGNGNGNPNNPGRPDKTTPPASVQTLISNFQAARENYLSQQKQLKLQLKTATEEERAAIREQLNNLLEQWKEQHREFVQEAKDRAKEMKNELSPDLGRVIDGAKDEGRGR